MPYLLDTNHCFRLIARDERILAALRERPSERLMTSVVVAGELRYGALISERRIENSVAVEDFLGRIDQVAVSPAISQIYADLKAGILLRLGPKDRAKRRSFDLTKLGFTDNDLWIAASALERDAIVVTEDPDFRRMATLEPLNVENWLS
ncbi:MAG: tRNA(fMet)-specific endonuclease VapC [Thermoanaerobaculia bacterium]|jgi:tRNA(fMet)-specific endonuclease VapC|nr:tRNA(fMet)-specific endonuclease VapC [Thermoanaerobaculia bacterium]